MTAAPHARLIGQQIITGILKHLSLKTLLKMPVKSAKSAFFKVFQKKKPSVYYLHDVGTCS